MKNLIISIFTLTSLVLAATPAQKVVETKSVKVEKQATEFDKIKDVYLKKAEELNKSKSLNQESIKKIVKSDSTLKAQQDSVLTSTKSALKAIYDSELAKLTEQEEILKQKKLKLEASYKEVSGTLETK